jgi:hypothetical protein
MNRSRFNAQVSRNVFVAESIVPLQPDQLIGCLKDGGTGAHAANIGLIY